jgi:hypothetical protein
MKTFTISGKVWRWKSPNGSTEGGWYFVYVPKKLSQQIKDSARNKKKVGFQFIRVKATIGKTSWNTSLFPTKDGPYLIAIKADVRKKESIGEGDSIKVECTLVD